MDPEKKTGRRVRSAAAIILALLLTTMTGCGADTAQNQSQPASASGSTEETSQAGIQAAGVEKTPADEAGGAVEDSGAAVSQDNVPAYSGSPYCRIDGGTPSFTADELVSRSYENYSSLDSLGRCGTAESCVGRDLMPTGKRGDISSIRPTGWHSVKYSCVEGGSLYNRCHLIAHELTAEDANARNLITGTRYLNIEGMAPFENMTTDYIKETGNHVMYRVTPVFSGNELVARGVHMEAESVEDGGDGISFNVYCYNVQPGVSIDYATGASSADGSSGAAVSAASAGAGTAVTDAGSDVTATYVLNENSKKFHKPDCSAVSKMSAKNRKNYSGSRAELISEGYTPCKICNP